jgi:hypothetical protein
VYGRRGGTSNRCRSANGRRGAARHRLDVEASRQQFGGASRVTDSPSFGHDDVAAIARGVAELLRDEVLAANDAHRARGGTPAFLGESRAGAAHTRLASNSADTAIEAPEELGPPPERWVSKRELARELGFTTRWVELQMRKGLPSRMIGGQRRYRYSSVEAWLSATYED